MDWKKNNSTITNSIKSNQIQKTTESKRIKKKRINVFDSIQKITLWFCCFVNQKLFMFFFLFNWWWLILKKCWFELIWTWPLRDFSYKQTHKHTNNNVEFEWIGLKANPSCTLKRRRNLVKYCVIQGDTSINLINIICL